MSEVKVLSIGSRLSQIEASIVALDEKLKSLSKLSCEIETLKASLSSISSQVSKISDILGPELLQME